MLNPRSFILDQRILFVGEEPGLAELEESENISPRAVVCRGGGCQGSGCHLHLQDPSVAPRRVIKFTLGVSEGPVDAVKAPKSGRQQKESQLSALNHGGVVGGGGSPASHPWFSSIFTG